MKNQNEQVSTLLNQALRTLDQEHLRYLKDALVARCSNDVRIICLMPQSAECLFLSSNGECQSVNKCDYKSYPLK